MAAQEPLTSLVEQALAQVGASANLGALEEVRVRVLGKKGLLTEQLKSLGALPAELRPAAGQKINDAKAAIQAALEARRGHLEDAALRAELAQGAIDVTLPGRGQDPGSLHPVTRTRLRIELRQIRTARQHWRLARCRRLWPLHGQLRRDYGDAALGLGDIRTPAKASST